MFYERRETFGQDYPYRRNTQTLILMLIFPVIAISMCNFFITYRGNVLSTKDNIRNESEKKLELLYTNLSPMYQLADTRRKDRVFSTAYLQNAQFMEAFFDIKRSLQRDSVWVSFFDSISYYNCEQEKVFTYSSISSPQDFFGWNGDDKMLYPVSSLKAEKEGMRLLSEKGSQVRTMRAHDISGQEGVIFAVPLEMDGNNIPRSYMIFTVSDKTFSNLWGDVEGVSYLLYYDKEAVYASGERKPEEWKETGAEEGFARLGALAIEWQLHGRYFVNRVLPLILAEVAVSFLILSVSLVLLLHYSRKNYEPVRNILRHFPQFTECGNIADEFRYIDFMLDDMANSRQTIETENIKMRKEKYLYCICGNPVRRGTDLYQKCLDAGIRVDRRWYVCIVLHDVILHDQLYDKFTQLEKQTYKCSNMYAMDVNDRKVIYLVASDMDGKKLQEHLDDFCREAGEKASVSSLTDGVESIPQAYRSICSVAGGEESETRLYADYPVLELQFLQAAFEEENVDKAQFAVSMLDKSVSDCDDSVRGAILFAAGTIFCGGKVDDINVEMGAMENFGVENSRKKLDEWIRKYCRKYCDRADHEKKLKKKALTRNMSNILKYIEENAASPNFTISMMAADFGTSQSNLGHQFKQATGQTISRFIDEWKIARAEEMLLDGETVSEIALKLGYLTTPAFTEAFKRIRGMTPSAWRGKRR